MRVTTFIVVDYLNSLWNQPIQSSMEDRIDQFAKHVCISICALSVLPFILCYDIGHEIGNNCYQRNSEEEYEKEVEEIEEKAPPRRSARLAEKQAKKLL
jgi:hypothetical protein